MNKIVNPTQLQNRQNPPVVYRSTKMMAAKVRVQHGFAAFFLMGSGLVTLATLRSIEWEARPSLHKGVGLEIKEGSFFQRLLFNAVQYGDTIRVEELLKEVNINTADRDGKTPLCVAAWNGHLNVVKLLLKNIRTDVNKSDMVGRTPLHLASHRGHGEIVEALLKDNRIRVNMADREGFTPLIEAAFSGMVEVVRHLLCCRQ